MTIIFIIVAKTYQYLKKFWFYKSFTKAVRDIEK